MKRIKVAFLLLFFYLSFCSSGGQSGDQQPGPSQPQPPPEPSKVWIELGGSASGGGISNSAGDSSSPSLALDSSGNPVAAWMDRSSGKYQVYIKRWDGVAWVELGAGSATGGGISNSRREATWPSLALDSAGNPVVAWMDKGFGRNQIYIKRFSGGAWVEIGKGSASGKGISGSKRDAMRPSVALDASGNPAVAWYDSGSDKFQVYIKRFNGSSWAKFGKSSAYGKGISGAKKYAAHPSLALDASGNPVVAWENSVTSRNHEVYIKLWNGSAWVEPGKGSGSLGGVSNNNGVSSEPELALDSSGNLIVAWADNTSGKFEIYVKSRSGGSWGELGIGSASGKGVSGNLGNSGFPAIAVDSSGAPMVAWTDNQAGKLKICIKRWDGSQWVEAGPGIAPGESNSGVYLSLALTSTDSPVVAWMDKSSGTFQIYLKRWIP